MTADALKSLGLSEQKTKETLKNAALTAVLFDIVKEAQSHLPNAMSKSVGNLLYNFGTKLKPQFKQSVPLVVKHICSDGIKNEAQLAGKMLQVGGWDLKTLFYLFAVAALEFLLAHSVSSFTESEFKEAVGIGVDVSPEDIERTVDEVITKYRDELKEERYSFSVGKLYADVRQSLKWADGKIVKEKVDAKVLSLLGPKTAEDDASVKLGKNKGLTSKDKPTKSSDLSSAKQPLGNGVGPNVNGVAESDEGAATIGELMKNKVHFHKPGENYKTEGYVVTPNTMDLMKKHLAITGGKVMTRFPPEPNGILHIGHAKAININFGYAQAHGGHCYLRFDDTNPEKEEEKFFLGIRDMVDWLGYKPYKITHASDNFDQLYEWAKLLISKGLAYVCHQKADEIKGFNPPPSPYRDRSVEESLRLLDDMRQGLYEEGEATLRMKVTLEEGKQDPVAYRIKYVPHPRSGNKWCIYPTYDYTHCLCDSIEHITHSLCTKEFQSRRSSYYWLCNALDIYCPVQWEYGRLNMNYTVVSKRKILKLIQEKIVSDWDDPRLFTLTALRRRGFPAEAINNFVARMGVTMAQVVVDPQMLEASVRDVLDVTAQRAMAVIDPLKLKIINFPSNAPKQVSVPNFPAKPERGSHLVAFGPEVFIDRSDFREQAEAGFKRFTTNQTVALKYASYVLTVKEVHKDAGKRIVQVDVTAEPLNDKNKPKAFIQWVSEVVECEIRIYERLFLHKNPEDPTEVPNGFLSDINPASLSIIPRALVDTSVRGAAVFQKFQFERIGFFSVDPDSTKDKLVFNRTVLLKEDSAKSGGN